jgi:hypothetical protein
MLLEADAHLMQLGLISLFWSSCEWADKIALELKAEKKKKKIKESRGHGI